MRIGMGPEGLVIVWLAGPSTSVDIVRFQAHEIPPVDLNKILSSSNYWHDWKDRATAQKEYADSYILSNSVRMENLKNIVDQISYQNISGESAILVLDKLIDASFSKKAVLDYIFIIWRESEMSKN